ncbi:cytoplasmic protein [Salmonella enterica subsp. salamae]|nr:cytoplasmic protein [Salmonella enterica subsp. salamae]ECJ2280073.1 cytoplasmic protein [Salmonella enterica subsp. salamae]HCC0886920.1 cytoplasmic protein [Salmonella enterica]
MSRPDPDVLQLYRYFWQPARYAAPEWLHKLGFYPSTRWNYGDRPKLDRLLDRSLQRLRGSAVIPATLNDRQKRQVRLAPRMTAFALGLGLIKLRCSDYFMLPEYRQFLLRWLSEEEIWRLYGWLGQKNGALLSPQAMQQTALQIGTAILNREAYKEVVLHALLVLLPPPQRILWPKVSLTEMVFMEQLL